MSKRFVLTIILLLTLLLPSHAVLKERDIAGTLAMLRIELTNYHTSLERQSDYMKEQRLQVMKQLVDALNKSQQNALMLYSQKNGYVFSPMRATKPPNSIRISGTMQALSGRS